MDGAQPTSIGASAPIRICDIGGWTDTWFAGHGRVFHIAVSPRVEVQLTVHRVGTVEDRVVLNVQNYGDRYAFAPGALPGRHPLIEATVEHVPLPDDMSVEISILSAAPAGGSTGTSAAVTVALLGALDALTPGRLTRYEIARAAHRVETERLGIQSGIQDQLCAAFGGINYIEMPAYPEASVTQLQVPSGVWEELGARLVLVYLGRAHMSSAVHEQVIDALAREGARSARLEDLRRAADDARDAASSGDLAALGSAMARSTEAQGRLHDSLISADARTVIEVARAHGALGWKVNGAGGEGGSVTLLVGSDPQTKRALLLALGQTNPTFDVVPTRLSKDGLRVWQE